MDLTLLKCCPTVWDAGPELKRIPRFVFAGMSTPVMRRTSVRRQTAVTAYFSSKQLPLFVFALGRCLALRRDRAWTRGDGLACDRPSGHVRGRWHHAWTPVMFGVTTVTVIPRVCAHLPASLRLYCRAKPKGSIGSLAKWGDTAFRLCTAV